MKDYFLKQLKKLGTKNTKGTNFIEAVYKNYPYDIDEVDITPSSKIENSTTEVKTSSEKTLEKTLKSFDDFAHKKIQEKISEGMEKTIVAGLEIISKKLVTLPFLNDLEIQEVKDLNMAYLKEYEELELKDKIVFFDLNLPSQGQVDGGYSLTKQIVDSSELLKNMMIAMERIEKRPDSEIILINYAVGEDSSITYTVLKELLALMEKNGFPKVIVPLGYKASNCLLRKEERISNLRGKFVEREYRGKICTIMPLIHPDMLKNPSMKATTWEDMKKIIQLVGT